MLVRSLTEVAEALPGNKELLKSMRLQLLDLLSLAISRKPFNSSTTQAKFQALSAALAAGKAGAL